MNGKQNLVFFLGVILIFMVFWVNGYWSILSNGLGLQSNSSAGAKLPGPGGIPVNPSTGKCPPGYTSAYGKCWPPTSTPTPPPVIA